MKDSLMRFTSHRDAGKICEDKYVNGESLKLQLTCLKRLYQERSTTLPACD